MNLSFDEQVERIAAEYKAEAEREAKRKPVSAGHKTPQVTIEAIMIAVGERGPAALQEPVNIERLSRCDNSAIEQIDERIRKLFPSERGGSSGRVGKTYQRGSYGLAAPLSASSPGLGEGK